MENKSGIVPCGNHILIKPDAIEEFTDGGIFIPEQVLQRHEASACYGYVIAVGPDAFTHLTVRKYRVHDNGRGELYEEDVRGYAGSFAAPGDRIAFAIYAGLESTGEDGEKYKVINDTDITAKVSEHVTQTSIEARKPYSAG